MCGTTNPAITKTPEPTTSAKHMGGKSGYLSQPVSDHPAFINNNVTSKTNNRKSAHLSALKDQALCDRFVLHCLSCKVNWHGECHNNAELHWAFKQQASQRNNVRGFLAVQGGVSHESSLSGLARVT